MVHRGRIDHINITCHSESCIFMLVHSRMGFRNYDKCSESDGKAHNASHQIIADQVNYQKPKAEVLPATILLPFAEEVPIHLRHRGKTNSAIEIPIGPIAGSNNRICHSSEINYFKKV